MQRCTGIALLAIVMALLAGCKDKAAPRAVTYAHPNNWIVAAPASQAVEVTAAGFLIRPMNWRQRRGLEVIRVEMREGSPSSAPWRKRRNLSGGIVRYRSFIRDGGSGGQEHVLQAWRVRPGGFFWLEQVVQLEFGKPSFELGWQVLETARMQ